MFNKDREDGHESQLNMTEYLASFINYEGVKQTREAREKQKIMSDTDFEQILRDTFGRDLTPEGMSKATRADTQEAPVKTAKKKKGEISLDDIKKYANISVELDDVKFIPNKK